MVRAGRLVDQQPDRTVVIRDDDVRIAIVVDVAEGRAAPDFRQPKDSAAAIGDVLEPAVAEIPEQLLPLVQREGIVRPRQRFDHANGAVDAEHVQPSVVVDVDPRRPEARIRKA
jgi:hypothetical protein